MKLNYNGNDIYKTEFGGVVFLIVAVISIFLTIINQFSQGISLSRPITFHSVTENYPDQPNFFDYTD
jgi:hypothetical protein